MSETPPGALNLTAIREILARVTMAVDANADGDSPYVNALLTDLKDDLEQLIANREAAARRAR